MNCSLLVKVAILELLHSPGHFFKKQFTKIHFLNTPYKKDRIV